MEVTNELEDKTLNYISNYLADYYVHNKNPQSFLSHYHYSIPLHEFQCFAYGNQGDQRTIHPIRILKILQNRCRLHYYIQIESSEPIWIHDTICLRKYFFEFQDKTSFFRSTFLYDPRSQDLFRLQSILPFLFCERYNEEGILEIYQKPWFKKKYETKRLAIPSTYFFISTEKRRKMIMKKWKELLPYAQAFTGTEDKNENLQWVIHFLAMSV